VQAGCIFVFRVGRAPRNLGRLGGKKGLAWVGRVRRERTAAEMLERGQGHGGRRNRDVTGTWKLQTRRAGEKGAKREGGGMMGELTAGLGGREQHRADAAQLNRELLQQKSIRVVAVQ